MRMKLGRRSRRLFIWRHRLGSLPCSCSCVSLSMPTLYDRSVVVDLPPLLCPANQHADHADSTGDDVSDSSENTGDPWSRGSTRVPESRLTNVSERRDGVPHPAGRSPIGATVWSCFRHVQTAWSL